MLINREPSAEQMAVYDKLVYVGCDAALTLRPAAWMDCRAPMAISSLLQKTTSTWAPNWARSLATISWALLGGKTFAAGEQSVYVDYVKVTPDNVADFMG